MKALLQAWWQLLKQTVSEYLEDTALSHGAAIAFYTITSLAPVLVIVIGIAGLAFGHKAAAGAMAQELQGLMGKQSADLLQGAVASAAGKSAGIVATVLGGITLLATASGVFGEMQSALNVIWKANPAGGTVSKLVKARIASLGLVMTLGFLLMVSLVASAGITALSGFIDAYIPFGHLLLAGINFLISFALISVLFAAIYKTLPDKHMEWRDVIVGAVVTSALFTIGKTGIGLYLGSSTVASSYGAAGGLIIALLWVYYSAQIFLLGAEFTKVYAVTHGSHQGSDLKDPRHVSQQARPAATIPSGGVTSVPTAPHRTPGWQVATAVGSVLLLAKTVKALRRA
jgi:membrane protein